ncbi:MAG TPA: hypothetical protein PKD63_06090 [Solirubrobacteraceae bacterium]|nr:hypothetical protein [Solirubrobacteraceae bacterium]
MGRASASITLPATRIADAEALWYDLTRWPSFVEGFKHVVKVEGDWPQAPSVLVWESVPDGRGQVTEAVSAFAQRDGQTADVEDPRMVGRQTVAFAATGSPGEDPGVRMTLALDYELRDRGLLSPVTDLLFIRRAQSDALRRTLLRFARELQAEREL